MESFKWESNLKISKLKLNLQKIINNIKTLERVDTKSSQINYDQIEYLKEDTEQMLQHAENMPVKKIRKILKKRNLNRKISKVKSKCKIAKFPKNIPITFNEATTIPATRLQSLSTSTQIKKPHVQLRSYYEAQRFLRIFELLKMLHYTRCQDSEKTRQFSTKLNNLHNIWQQILEENQPQRTQECKIEDQWNEALFGPSEKTYYASTPKLNNFIRIRQIWDSYIVDNSDYGSSIPRGWITPVEDAGAEWLKFRVGN